MADNILAGSGVYKILNKVNGKAYVGSAAKFSKRWREHRSLLMNGRHHSRKLQSAWNKYGPDSFEFLVLELVPELSLLLSVEQRWIDKLNVVVSGYNLCPVAGSALGREYPEEIRKKYGDSFRGKTHSLETRAAIVASNQSRVVSEETRKKISQAGTGKKRSEESRRAISDGAKRRRENERASGTLKSGYKLSDEHRQKIKDSWVHRKLKAASTSM